MGIWARIGLLTLGGALGTNARYWLGVWVAGLTGSRFPVATLVINVLGSFLAGLLAGVLARLLPHPYWRILILVGFLGGFTTFSALELESLELLRRDGWRPAIANLLGSIVLGLVAVTLGALLARGLFDSGEAPRPLAKPSSGAD